MGARVKYGLAAGGLAVAVATVASLVAARGAQSPASPIPMQNGRLDVRRGVTIEAAIASAARGTAGEAADPVWVAWRVPLADAAHDLCSWYGDWTGAVRGVRLDPSADGSTPDAARPPLAPPSGPVPLEAGTGLLVLVRIAGGQSERIRSLGDDCPIDAGGRTVYLLEGITADASMGYLERHVGAAIAGRMNEDARRRRQQSALRAIALHRDGVPRLIAIARTAADAAARKDAVSALGQTNDPRAFAYLAELIRR